MRTLGWAAAVLALGGLGALPVAGQSGEAEDTLVFRIDPVVVTATRGPRALSRIPQPVSVIQLRDLREAAPNTISDLFKRLPGVDVTGVGVNQGRPRIRGLQGQRILLLADGLRLNNSRRQSDFGELPALVDVQGVERVEVVRGPSSVLYGSDALGGVVNVITRTPSEDGLHGTGSFRYGGVEEQKAGSFRAFGRFGGLSVRAGGTVREAGAYTAPAGSFGEIELADEVTVHGSGTRDHSADLRLGYETAGAETFVKLERYGSDDSGFGFVDPAAYSPFSPRIEITYPSQTFMKLSAGVRLNGLDVGVADQVDVRAYGQDNERQLRFGIGPFPTGPMTTMELDNLNTTDIRTFGVRAEARKLAAPGVLLTYGLDAWRDRAEGTDENTTTITGLGPVPVVSTDDRPQLPEATFRSIGLFAQGEVEATDRLSVVVGARWQETAAETFSTPGLMQTPVDVSDGTVVASLNTVFAVDERVSVVGSVGRGFRSPNLIERFFDGPTPEGGGYQVRNPELAPETSLNFDLGIRVRDGRVGGELFVYQNRIADGIRVEALGRLEQGMPAFQMTNVDELRVRGVELSVDAELGGGVSLTGSFSKTDMEDANDTENPVGDAFSRKSTAGVRYDRPDGRLWVVGELRNHGERRDVDLGGSNPIGATLPGFTVADARAGITVWRNAGMEHRLNIAVTNLTNALYAEFANAAFFRPEPKRNLTLSWSVDF